MNGSLHIYGSTAVLRALRPLDAIEVDECLRAVPADMAPVVRSFRIAPDSLQSMAWGSVREFLRAGGFPSLHVLDFANNALGAANASEILRACSKSDLPITDVEMSGNAFGQNQSRAIPAFASALASLPHLVRLRLDRCGMGLAALESLGHEFGQVEPRLEELSLSGNDVGLGISYLRKGKPWARQPLFPFLRTLRMRNCGLHDSGFALVCDSLKDYSLQDVDFANNILGDPGAEILAALLHDWGPDRVRLDGNCFGMDGVRLVLAELLQFPCLMTLQEFSMDLPAGALEWSGPTGMDGWRALAMQLVEPTTTVQAIPEASPRKGSRFDHVLADGVTDERLVHDFPAMSIWSGNCSESSFGNWRAKAGVRGRGPQEDFTVGELLSILAFINRQPTPAKQKVGAVILHKLTIEGLIQKSQTPPASPNLN